MIGPPCWDLGKFLLTIWPKCQHVCFDHYQDWTIEWDKDRHYVGITTCCRCEPIDTPHYGWGCGNIQRKVKLREKRRASV